jgi:hypothetical protein
MRKLGTATKLCTNCILRMLSIIAIIDALRRTFGICNDANSADFLPLLSGVCRWIPSPSILIDTISIGPTSPVWHHTMSSLALQYTSQLADRGDGNPLQQRRRHKLPASPADIMELYANYTRLITGTLGSTLVVRADAHGGARSGVRVRQPRGAGRQLLPARPANQWFGFRPVGAALGKLQLSPATRHECALHRGRLALSQLSLVDPARARHRRTTSGGNGWALLFSFSTRRSRIPPGGRALGGDF